MGRKSDQERIDDLVLGDLATSGDYGGAGVPGLLFAVPTECLPNGRAGSLKVPGVYFRAIKPGKSPTAFPESRERRLDKTEAVAWAAACDSFATQVRGHMAGMSSADQFPTSYKQLVEWFYDALGRRLDRAIEAATERRTQLREVAAALSGKVH